jgi:hypothetical protein
MRGKGLIDSTAVGVRPVFRGPISSCRLITWVRTGRRLRMAEIVVSLPSDSAACRDAELALLSSRRRQPT